MSDFNYLLADERVKWAMEGAAMDWAREHGRSPDGARMAAKRAAKAIAWGQPPRRDVTAAQAASGLTQADVIALEPVLLGAARQVASQVAEAMPGALAVLGVSLEA